MRVPSSYQLNEVKGVVSITRPAAREFVERALNEHGTLYAFAAAHARRKLQGRTIAYVIDGPAGPWVVRHYRRGGTVAAMLGDRFIRIGARRPFSELWTSALARSRGIDTPAVMAVAIYSQGPFYRGDIATELIPGAADLASTSTGPERRSEPERRDAWFEAARLLRSLAGAGLFHADLNLRNILIAWRAGRPHAHVLDLDRCRIVRRIHPSDFDAMVQRVIRSAHKFERMTGESLKNELDAFREGLRG
jgi:3-deoxy-D-manno-octulosonic acid kinase